MNELLEFIDDLNTLNSLDSVSRESHIEQLIEKYQTQFEELEQDMARQHTQFGDC